MTRTALLCLLMILLPWTVKAQDSIEVWTVTQDSVLDSTCNHANVEDLGGTVPLTNPPGPLHQNQRCLTCFAVRCVLERGTCFDCDGVWRPGSRQVKEMVAVKYMKFDTVNWIGDTLSSWHPDSTTLFTLGTVKRMIDSAVAEEVAKTGKWRMEIHPEGCNMADYYLMTPCTTYTWVPVEGKP